MLKKFQILIMILGMVCFISAASNTFANNSSAGKSEKIESEKNEQKNHDGDTGNKSENDENSDENKDKGKDSANGNDNDSDNDSEHKSDDNGHYDDDNRGHEDSSDNGYENSDYENHDDSEYSGNDGSEECCPEPSPIFFTFSDSSGLGASATLYVENEKLIIELINTSLGVPSGFSNSDQLLTSFAFSLPAGTSISGGSAFISNESYSLNFSEVSEQLTEGTDVSTEWGYGNSGNYGFGEHLNFISSMTSHTTPFLDIPPGTNLDKSANLGGPESGLTNGALPLGGIGAIYNSITSSLTIAGIKFNDACDTIYFLSYIKNNGAIFEFGSDAAFGITDPYLETKLVIPVPEPSTLLLFLAGILLLAIKRF